MKKRSGNEIRELFLDYFKNNGHMIEPSVSLVPINDPTLLWINAGVAGLKKYFDGREKPANNRITNVQKCIRTNDIENVGKTSRHHTFFEMLGNFSIGDYFKGEAILFAWEFLTSPSYIGFDKNRMYVTVYEDDEEAYRIWTEVIKLPKDHILKSKNNYWQIGEGPCGPDSEIYYDRGEKYDLKKIGEKLFFEEMDNDRYIEVWNVVFSQYDGKEGVDRKDYKELPQKNIDTGMGLERLTCLVQDGETNFDTDLFLPIIYETEKFSKIKYKKDKMSYRIIADHIRTCVFALSDGAVFSNDGRGYVLRRVIRRAMKYARKLGINKPFLSELVDTVIKIYGKHYDYLDSKKDFVKKLILKEEKSFSSTLANGEKLLEEEIKNSTDKKLSGEVIFKLYDTYGFPVEMTMETAAEKGITCDIEGFKACMEKQIQMARAARGEAESMHNQEKDLMDLDTEFKFTGYSSSNEVGTVVALFKDGKRVDELTGEGDIIFDKTCFYAESGGQCADKGVLSDGGEDIEVLDVQKSPNGQFKHHVKLVDRTVKVGDYFDLSIDKKFRLKVMSNHTSLHLLQSALRKVLGSHVAQAGSYVCDSYARFDFSHYEKITPLQLHEVEGLVNKYIAGGYRVKTEIMSLEDAKNTNAIALFDEKYGDTVRVVSMGTFSKEFCGGTHARKTSELGLFKIISEESIGSGIRRIVCKTKYEAYKELKKYDEMMHKMMDDLKLKNVDQVPEKVNSLVEELKDTQSKYSNLLRSTMELKAREVSDSCYTVDNLKYIFVREKDSMFSLRDYAISIRNRIDNGLVIIFNETSDKYTFICAAGDNAIKKGLNAKDIIDYLVSKSEFKGGGKIDFSQAGSPKDGELDSIISLLKVYIKEKLA